MANRVVEKKTDEGLLIWRINQRTKRGHYKVFLTHQHTKYVSVLILQDLSAFRQDFTQKVLA